MVRVEPTVSRTTDRQPGTGPGALPSPGHVGFHQGEVTVVANPAKGHTHGGIDGPTGQSRRPKGDAHRSHRSALMAAGV